MDFFGFSLVGAYPNRPHAAAIHDFLEMVEAADRWGLDGWYFSEHHIDAAFSISPSPNLLVAAVARRTTRLRLGNMVTVLPYNHPLRVAEELRTLDILSGGRLEVGFGRGQIRSEQTAFGVDRESTVAMFDIAFDIVVRLLRGETVDFDTPWWSGRQAIAIPEATQPSPPLWISAASPESVEKCARLGVGCATALLTRKFADERLAWYRELWTRHQPDRPGEDRFAITANVAVADTEGEAIDQVRTELASKQEHFAHAVSDRPQGEDPSYASHKPQYEAFANSTIESMLDDGLLIAGDVQQCREQVERIRDRGIDRVICTFHNPQSPFDFALRSMELFLKEVAPAVFPGERVAARPA